MKGMLCRWQRAVLAIVLLTFLAPAILPIAPAQGPPGNLLIRTDSEMIGAPGLRGGGHITWTLSGEVAIGLRQRVVAMFDGYTSIPRGFAWGGTPTPGNRDGALSAAETKAFTDLLEAEIEGQRQALGGTRWRYLRIERTDLSERDLPIDRSVDGLVGRGPNATEPVEIRFIYDGRTMGENVPFALASRDLADGLYSLFGLRQAQNLDTGPTGVWPLQAVGGWHVVQLAGDGRAALWEGNPSGDPDPLNGTYDDGITRDTLTSTSPGLPGLDLRFATAASVSFQHMGRSFDAGDTLRLQIAPGPAFTAWTDLTDAAGDTVLPNTAPYAWRTVAYDLGAYLGQVVQLRLRFESNAAGNAAPGFFVRDFVIDAPAVYTGDLIVSDVDYMVGTVAFEPAAAPGRLHLIRTPAGEILVYGAAFSPAAPPGDGATFRGFLWYENPQVLLIVLIAAAYLIARFQNRAYLGFRGRHPREYRASALQARWLHWCGRGAIIALIVLYLFPTALGVFGSSAVVTGVALWVVAFSVAAGVSVGTWFMYRRRARLIPPAHDDATTVVEPPPPEAPAVWDATEMCAQCLTPIATRDDALPCACGQLYHRSCSAALGACPACGRRLGDPLAPKPAAKSTSTCGACGTVQPVDAGSDPMRTRCSACGAPLQMPEPGYNYLVLTTDAAPVYGWFGRLVRQGTKGLAVSTTFPDKLRKDYRLETAELLWLSDTNKGPTTLDPRRLEFEMMRALMGFIRSNPGGALVVDGLEHLVVENTLERVLRFVKRLNDLASVNRITLFVPVAAGSLAPEDLSVLQQAFDRVVDLRVVDVTA